MRKIKMKTNNKEINNNRKMRTRKKKIGNRIKKRIIKKKEIIKSAFIQS